MEALHVVFEPAKVEEWLTHYGYKPTKERVDSVLQIIAESVNTDVDQVISDVIEYIEADLGEKDLETR